MPLVFLVSSAVASD